MPKNLSQSNQKNSRNNSHSSQKHILISPLSKQLIKFFNKSQNLHQNTRLKISNYSLKVKNNKKCYENQMKDATYFKQKYPQRSIKSSHSCELKQHKPRNLIKQKVDQIRKKFTKNLKPYEKISIRRNCKPQHWFPQRTHKLHIKQSSIIASETTTNSGPNTTPPLNYTFGNIMMSDSLKLL